MAEEVRYVEHPQADLSGMINAVQNMAGQVNSLASEVLSVNAQVDSIQESFTGFLQEFRRFVEQDLKDRRLQEALTDQVTLQQELEQRFSRHQMIRKYVTGILQAADVSLVKKETISNVTEELMVAIPHYWLAPALIALAAWLNDDKPLAEKAIREAMSRDDEKTSLLFCLICRRASRNQAANTWLHRYFSMQDPMSIERKLVVVLDAYANGMFGSDSRGLCAQQIGGWIAEMEDTVGFREKQVENWMRAIRGKIPGESFNAEYPYLAKYAKNWSEIVRTLNNGMLHSSMKTYLEDVFQKKNADTTDLKRQLDALLDSLVSNYDAEELPLRERKRLADLIVVCKGDESEATRRFDAERSAFNEKSDLTELLTNAAMNPELVHASPATQKLSMAISRDWLIEAYENVTLENRNSIVREIGFDLEGFEGQTLDGANEEPLCQAAEEHFTRIRDGRLEAVKQSVMDYFIAGAGVLLLILGIFGSIPWFIGLLAAGLAGVKFYLGRKKTEKEKTKINQEFDKIITNSKSIIRAICAETIDLRRRIVELDRDYEPLMNYMQDIAPERFVQNKGQRNITIA